MKKLTLIFAVVALMIATSLLAQNDSEKELKAVTNEIMKAYKTQDWQLLLKAAGGKSFFINDKYFTNKKYKEYTEMAGEWDGVIKDIRYDVLSLPSHTVVSAEVYVADKKNKKSGEIYVVELSNKDNTGWHAYVEGISTISRNDFEEMSKTYTTPASSHSEVAEKTDIKDKFVLTHNSMPVDEMSEKNIADLIEHPQDPYFNTVQLKFNDDYLLAKYIMGKYLINYKENGVIYESKNKLSKETTVGLFKKYLAHDTDWNKGVEWEKFKSITGENK